LSNKIEIKEEDGCELYNIYLNDKYVTCVGDGTTIIIGDNGEVTID